jgi:hypothetical protein
MTASNKLHKELLLTKYEKRWHSTDSCNSLVVAWRQSSRIVTPARTREEASNIQLPFQTPTADLHGTRPLTSP